MNTALVWFRQDLRITDNPAFISACQNHDIVIPLYIYDKKSSLLGQAQEWWLHHSLEALNSSLNTHGLTLILRQGDPFDILLELTERLAINSIYWNRCYEPEAIARDTNIKAAFIQKDVSVNSFNGSLLNEPWTIKNGSGDYFKVFTPYWRKCLQNIHAPSLVTPKSPNSTALESEDLHTWNLLPKSPNWASGFSDYWEPGELGAQKRLTTFIEDNLKGYQIERDHPAKDSTSRLSPHLHFGEISPWAIWRAVELAKLDPKCDLVSAARFLSELGWREFSYHLLYHVPTLPHENFKPKFNAFPWNTATSDLKRWQTGTTGYPLIDAGMRELWATGYMHNRVRMIAASFLTKHLLIDWRHGADWFLHTLVDADLANNSAGWQWVAGCGADAAPYFRIFNPILQSQKFDADGAYIRKWVPELRHLTNKTIHTPWLANNLSQATYPPPIIDHNEARTRALRYYHLLSNHEFGEK